ncbi:hypothetical protein AC578_215 [Pseudocercospora eumusae]|uniref:Uncharacterized protein n=1 Tax=Pseudocercospora eumusae TaxID=321146 RepID=A0A139HIU6_9PEZI|nr:hypothetical protein AC578_215 [Pseudocercospora eumusae]
MPFIGARYIVASSQLLATSLQKLGRSKKVVTFKKRAKRFLKPSKNLTVGAEAEVAGIESPQGVPECLTHKSQVGNASQGELGSENEPTGVASEGNDNAYAESINAESLGNQSEAESLEHQIDEISIAAYDSEVDATQGAGSDSESLRIERDVEEDVPAESLPESENDIEGLLYDFDIYRQQLDAATEQFELREMQFDEELREYNDRVLAGSDVESLSEIELRQLQKSRELTRTLIEAEGEFDLAKAALLNAGIQPPGSDIASGFVDDVDDGYRISAERDWIVNVDSNRIHRWLGEIPDETQLESSESDDDSHIRESDPWSAREVEICDSWSMVADGAQRRRIDKWRALAAATMNG